MDKLEDQTIPANGSALVGNLSPGEHQVALQEVPASCSVAGDNPRAVSVTSGTEIATRFDVTCVATTGVIAVELSTTGEGSDPTGYAILIDGGARSEPSGANGVARVTDVLPGTHSVELGEVAANCEVQTPTSREVTVVVGETTNTSFAIECAAPAPLSNQILYLSERDGRKAIWIVSPDGSDLVRLPAPVSTQGAEWPDISSDGSLIAYTYNGQTRIVQSDGNFVATLSASYCPTWSPDDSRIAYAYSSSGPEHLWSVAVDGPQIPVPLTDLPDAFEWEPDWGTNGKIAFVRSVDGDQRLWVMNSDGGSPQPVTEDAVFDEGEPAWSPDGNWLLFSRTLATGAPDIWVVGSDLQNLRNLTNSPTSTDAKGAWSPDGSRIVFESSRGNPDFDLYIINFDGTGLTRLTDDPGYDGDATWSP